MTIDRRPFLLQPDKPAEGTERPLRDGEGDTELSAAWQERAGALGITMRRPNWSPNTTLVHEATLFAKEQGLDGEFHHRAAQSYWESGADLGDREVVERLARECGLDAAGLKEALESGRFRDEVIRENEAARGAGIGGTPTYQINGSEPTFGDLSADDIRELIKKAAGA